jgi:hypothetical protein
MDERLHSYSLRRYAVQRLPMTQTVWFLTATYLRRFLLLHFLEHSEFRARVVFAQKRVPKTRFRLARPDHGVYITGFARLRAPQDSHVHQVLRLNSARTSRYCLFSYFVMCAHAKEGTQHNVWYRLSGGGQLAYPSSCRVLWGCLSSFPASTKPRWSWIS